MQLLELTLKNNDFVFNGEFFLQTCGTAMGKTYALALADLYMEDFDDGAVNGFTIKPLLFSRFLDDIFFICTGDLQQLKDFETYLNNLIPGIKVTFDHSQESVNFLDTTIYKQHEDAYDILLTKVYFEELIPISYSTKLPITHGTRQKAYSNLNLSASKTIVLLRRLRQRLQDTAQSARRTTLQSAHDEEDEGRHMGIHHK
jgi:hypothetical protein